MLVIVKLVMQDLTPVVNEQFFGCKNYFQLEQKLKQKPTLRARWLPDTATFLSKISKEKHHFKFYGLKTTVQGHYAQNTCVWGHK